MQMLKDGPGRDDVESLVREIPRPWKRRAMDHQLVRIASTGKWLNTLDCPASIPHQGEEVTARRSDIQQAAWRMGKI
jgi:hypothetical protein